MAVYCVQLSGSRIKVRFGDKEVECGFIKNEYLFARNERTAQQKAIARVERKLKRRIHLNPEDVRNVQLTVDSIESGFGVLSTLRDEGFVFTQSTFSFDLTKGALLSLSE